MRDKCLKIIRLCNCLLYKAYDPDRLAFCFPTSSKRRLPFLALFDELRPTQSPVINRLLLSDRTFILLPLKLNEEICTA